MNEYIAQLKNYGRGLVLAVVLSAASAGVKAGKEYVEAHPVPLPDLGWIIGAASTGTLAGFMVRSPKDHAEKQKETGA